MAVEWIEVKDDWVSVNSFSADDYNKITNNLKYLNEHLKTPITLESMPTLTEDYEPWKPSEFNVLENNLHSISSNINSGATDIGIKKTFYLNGLFISADEINRIESALDLLKGTMESIKANQRRLSFKLGNFKNPRL